MKNNKKEEIVFIHSPQKKFQFLPANRLTKKSHVKSLMGAMLRGEWIPPIFVTTEGYIVDGQNRYQAFCNLCNQNPSANYSLRVLFINSNEGPTSLAIRFNTCNKKWLAKDYFHAYITQKVPSYIRLAEFLGRHKQLQGVKAGLQIIKGSHGTKIFQSGSLKITEEEIREAEVRIFYLNKVYQVVKDSLVYSRDVIAAFYIVFNEVKNLKTFYANLASKFKKPITQKCTDWVSAYRACL